jgi:hypothetical protein
MMENSLMTKKMVKFIPFKNPYLACYSEEFALHSMASPYQKCQHFSCHFQLMTFPILEDLRQIKITAAIVTCQMDSEDFIKIKVEPRKDLTVATAAGLALLSWVQQLQQLVFKVTKSSLILG